MPTLTDLSALVEQFAAAIPDLNLTGDEQEEYSTMLSRLQDQIETGEPTEDVVKECLAYFAGFESQSGLNVQTHTSVAVSSTLRNPNRIA
jgi:hypothetical protein